MSLRECPREAFYTVRFRALPLCVLLLYVCYCCISCCPCSAPCATCQMMRHEGFHEDGYNMCHPTGKDLELGTTPEV